MASQVAVQRGARQVRDGCLSGIAAVGERQQPVSAESDNEGFLHGRLSTSAHKVRCAVDAHGIRLATVFGSTQ